MKLMQVFTDTIPQSYSKFNFDVDFSQFLRSGLLMYSLFFKLRRFDYHIYAQKLLLPCVGLPVLHLLNASIKHQNISVTHKTPSNLN